MNFKAKTALFCAAISLVGTQAFATPISVTATVTADNHYILFYGDQNGDNLTKVLQNEIGEKGDPGKYNWSLPETKSFTMDDQQQLFIAAWSDNGVAQAWIGQFVTQNQTLLTNTSDWLWKPTNQDLNTGSVGPGTSDVASHIALGGWKAIPNVSGTNYRDNGAEPWGSIAGISTQADWIWGEAIAPGSGKGEYHIYTARFASVPEPATMSLMIAGLLSLVFIRRKRR